MRYFALCTCTEYYAMTVAPEINSTSKLSENQPLNKMKCEVFVQNYTRISAFMQALHGIGYTDPMQALHGIGYAVWH